MPNLSNLPYESFDISGPDPSSELMSVYIISVTWTPGGGGVLPMWWVIHMCRGFDPLFSLWQDRARSFWGTFSHPPTAKLSFGVQKLPIFTKINLFGCKFNFFLDLFGSNFSGQRHTPISFQAEYPPPPGHGRLTSCSSHKSPCQCSPCVGLVSDPPACMTRLLLTVSTCSTPVQDIGVSAEGCLWLWVHSHGGMNSPPASWWVQRGWGCWGTWLTPHLAVEKDYN